MWLERILLVYIDNIYTQKCLEDVIAEYNQEVKKLLYDKLEEILEFIIYSRDILSSGYDFKYDYCVDIPTFTYTIKGIEKNIQLGIVISNLNIEFVNNPLEIFGDSAIYSICNNNLKTIIDLIKIHREMLIEQSTDVVDLVVYELIEGIKDKDYLEQIKEFLIS